MPHITCFIVPRQILRLGDPARRSCDACESFGAWLKKTIKERTCRRRLRTDPSKHTRKDGDGGIITWEQHFKKGYIQQAFSRAVVTERLGHGRENEPYLQRADWKRLQSGKSTTKYDKVCRPLDEDAENGDAQQRNLKDLVAEQQAGVCPPLPEPRPARAQIHMPLVRDRGRRLTTTHRMGICPPTPARIVDRREALASIYYGMVCSGINGTS